MNKHPRQHPGLIRIATCTAFAITTALTSLQSAPVIKYSFEGNLNDSASGGSVADTLSYNQGASLSGTPQYGPGVGGGLAAVFDGNWFQAPDSIDADIADNTWAMETFVKVSVHNAQWERLIVKWGTSNNYHLSLETKDLNFFTGNPVGNVFDRNTSPLTNFTNGQWHHVAFSSSATGSEAWIDGVSVFTGASVTLLNGTDPLGIGDFGTAGVNNGLRMHGFMDEIIIHDTPIDQTYINGRVALIPEPASASLLLLGTLGFGLVRRRR